jgi:hypothetical protein
VPSATPSGASVWRDSDRAGVGGEDLVKALVGAECLPQRWRL